MPIIQHALCPCTGHVVRACGCGVGVAFGIWVQVQLQHAECFLLLLLVCCLRWACSLVGFVVYNLGFFCLFACAEGQSISFFNCKLQSPVYDATALNRALSLPGAFFRLIYSKTPIDQTSPDNKNLHLHLPL